MGELGCTLLEEEITPGLHTSPMSGNGTNPSSLTSQGAEQSCEQVLWPRGAQGPREPGALSAALGPAGTDRKWPGCSVPGFQQEALPWTPGEGPSCGDRPEAAGLQRPRLPAGGGSCRVRPEVARLQRPRLPAGGATPDAREGPCCGVPRRERMRPSRWSVRGGARSGPASPQGGGRVAATS